MSETELEARLRQAFAAREVHTAPDFDAAWAAAEARERQRRWRYRAFAASAVLIAVVIVFAGLRTDTQAPDEFLIADALMNETLWAAPSDTLLPERQFDIYQEVPSLMQSTDIEEGSLL